MTSSETIISPITKALIRYLTNFKGIDLTEISNQTKVYPNVLTNSEGRYSFKEMDLIWLFASKILNDKLIGFHIGQFLQVNAIGIVGHLMQSCDTIGEVINTACQYTNLSGGVMDLSNQLERNEFKIFFDYQSTIPTIQLFGVEQIRDAAMSLTTKMLKDLSGKEIIPSKVDLVQSKLDLDVSEYEKIFGIIPNFNCKRNTICFGTDVIKIPVTFSDNNLRSYLERNASAMLVSLKKKTDLSSKIKIYIMNNLWKKHLTLEMIAENFYMTPRTLQRKLASENTTYKNLLDDVRQDLAKDYLVRMNMSVSDTAYLLGFSEISAFNRAFKSWTGFTPKEYTLDSKIH